MAFELSNSFLEEFDFLFHPFLKERGAKLMQAVVMEPVQGDMRFIRQVDVGDAKWEDQIGGITEYAPQKFDKRRLYPRPFSCTLSMNDFDLVRQGTPDPGLLAQQAANSCGKLIDQLIIQGLGGTAYTEAMGEQVLSGAAEAGVTTADNSPEKCIAKYDTTQTIAWNDCTLGADDTRNSLSTRAGLNTSKVVKAIEKLTSANNDGPFVCVGSSYAMTTLRSDVRAASTDFNDIHSFMAGVNVPYGGCDVFIACNQVDGGKSAVAATGQGTNNVAGLDVEYAYIYSLPQVKLGCSMPLHMKSDINVERGFAQVIRYEGMYDCTRMFEESVVRIEILKNVSGVNPDGSAFAR